MHYPDIYISSSKSCAEATPDVISKRQIDGSLQLAIYGLERDALSPQPHAIFDQALSHFPCEHYHWLSQQFPHQEECLSAPSLGEDLSTHGMLEEDIFIGDIYRWDEALIQVSQPYLCPQAITPLLQGSPLITLLQQSGRCGWRYRVLHSGKVSNGYPLDLITRNSEVSIAEAFSIAFHLPYDEEQYRRLMASAGLSAEWSRMMQLRLLNHKIEDNRQ
jgi:MOSC domain-containing protein YiiM